MSDIYLSFAESDLETARLVAQGLERAGWSVWWHGPVLSGEVFERIIERELAAAGCIVVLWSRAAAESEEVELAVQRGKQRGVLAAVQIDESEVPSMLVGVSMSPLGDWRGDREHPAFQRICDSVRKLLADTEASAEERYASHGRRLVAFVVDTALVVAFYLAAAGRLGYYALAFFPLYHTASLAVWGRTLGKAVMGLTVKRQEPTAGKIRLSWWRALLRSTAGYGASTLFLLGFLNAFRDERRRCWHDVLFGSVVMQAPGALSLKRIARGFDKWTEELDEWRKSLFARYNRLKGLAGFALKLTLMMSLLRDWIEKAVRFIGRKLGLLKSEASVAGQQAAPLAGASAAGGLATAASTVTAVVLTAASVVGVGAAREAGPQLSVVKSAAELDVDSLGTGDVQVTLTWEGPADIDLIVVDPGDEIIFHGVRASFSGGRLDVDANQSCGGDAPVENIFWPPDSAPSGTYTVWVQYYQQCDESGPTAWRVELRVDGDTSVFGGMLDKPDSVPQVVTTFTR
jgi:uncharacterized RDD family membrane protein YckC